MTTGNYTLFGFNPFTGVPGENGRGFPLDSNGNYDFTNLKGVNVGNPSNPQDISTKSYVDLQVGTDPFIKNVFCANTSIQTDLITEKNVGANI